MGAPCDHSREGRIRKALTKLSILYSGALFKQQGRGPGSLCAPLACRSGSAVALGLPALLRKNRNPPSKGHKAVTGIRKKLPLLAYCCRLYTCTSPFLHPCGERGLTHWFASSSYQHWECSVLCEGEEGQHPAVPSSCTQPHHGTSFFPVWKFTCCFLPILFQIF